MAKNKRNASKTSKQRSIQENSNWLQHDPTRNATKSNKESVPWLRTRQAICSTAILSIAVYFFKSRTAVFSVLWSDQNVISDSDPMKECGLVMSNSSLPDSGWGMFTLLTIPESSPTSFGSPIVQIPDIPSSAIDAIGHLAHDYLWGADTTGGIREGRIVYSFSPGVGSLANGHPTQWNIAPSSHAQVDHANVTRQYPGAGAFTHYHGFQFYAHRKEIAAGEEILVNYGKGWLNKIPHDIKESKQSVDELRRHGICLDHIQPGISQIPYAGRGAFAVRSLSKGVVVTPLPLLPIKSKKALLMDSGQYQLLLNYCLGHTESSLLLVPYATVVNLINHNYDNPNVELRWSTSSLHRGIRLLHNTSLDEFWKETPYGLLLELVALRDIQPGDEIVMNYGSAWQLAWTQHLQSWQPMVDQSYVYSFEYNDQVNYLSTVQELSTIPYPSNIRTMCYYQYFPDTEQPVPYQSTPKLSKNLHPCHVIERNSTNNTYTVRMESQESPLLKQTEIPNNHIVHNIPRNAILLDDVPNTSDQHLSQAFRHEMHIPDGIFPRDWKDLIQ